MQAPIRASGSAPVCFWAADPESALDGVRRVPWAILKKLYTKPKLFSTSPL